MEQQRSGQMLASVRQMESIDEVLAHIERVIDTIVAIVGGLRITALVFAFGALVGGVLFWIALAMTVGPWWLGLIPALATLIPATGLWKLRGALEPTMALADNIGEISLSRESLTAAFTGEVNEMLGTLGSAKELPKTPMAFFRSARSVKGAMDTLQSSAIGQITQGTMGLSPVVLIPGGFACLWAGAAFVFGATFFILAVFL